MSKHQFTIQKILSRREGGGVAPLGSKDALYALFGVLNTAPEVDGGTVLYGPGIRVELMTNGDTVESIDLRVTEDDLFALLFEGTSTDSLGRLARMVKTNGWHLFNLETGQCYPRMVNEPDDEDETDA